MATAVEQKISQDIVAFEDEITGLTEQIHNLQVRIEGVKARLGYAKELRDHVISQHVAPGAAQAAESDAKREERNRRRREQRAQKAAEQAQPKNV